MKISGWLSEHYGKRKFTANASKTKKPKFHDYAGRTWDKIGELNDGTNIYADTTWGLWGYFSKAGQWYKFRFIGL